MSNNSMNMTKSGIHLVSA